MLTSSATEPSSTSKMHSRPRAVGTKRTAPTMPAISCGSRLSVSSAIGRRTKRRTSSR